MLSRMTGEVRLSDCGVVVSGRLAEHPASTSNPAMKKARRARTGLRGGLEGREGRESLAITGV